jgi:hypothetical protein
VWNSLVEHANSGSVLLQTDLFQKTPARLNEPKAAAVGYQSSSATTSLVDNFDIDLMNNKTFSSTGISQVTATAMLPTYDGAGDASRRNAKSMLSLMDRWKSPRLIQRSTPTGSAWYGPYSREIKNQTQSEGS